MKFSSINKGNLDMYKALIPEIFLGIIEAPNIVPFGVDEGNNPLGVMICEIQSAEQLMLKWICVDEQYRRNGIATLMYNSFCSILKDKGYKQLNTMLEDDEAFKDLFLFLSAMSNTSFFVITDDLVRIKASDISEILEKYSISTENVKPISDVPSYKLTEAITEANDMPLLEKQYKIRDYQTGSALITEKDKIIGLYLCRKGMREKEYEITYFLNNSSSALNLMKMIKFSADNLLLEDKDAYITVTTVNGFAKKIVLLSENKATKVVLSGCVSHL